GEEPDNTRERVMRAVLVVLRRHGYAGLSIKRIADEAGLEKASIYHHYSDKDDLLFSFLEFVLGLFEREIIQQPGRKPEDQLRELIDRATLGAERASTARNPERAGTVTEAFMIVRSQAIHDRQYRDRITEVDEQLREHLADLTRAAMDDQRQDNADHVATSLQTMMAGAFFQRTTAVDPNLDPARRDAHAYLDRHLGAED
ncbi:MAG: transcriptional regulator, partial [uncultured archaeon A07HR67]